MAHLDDILPELLLGTVDPPARQVAEQHLAGCEPCRAELARVVAEMEGPGRFARFVEKVAAFFGLTRERTLALLESLSDPDAWMPGPVDGLQLMPVETGPAKTGMLAAFVRLTPGVRFPRHTHHGYEWNLVLEGG